MEIIDKDERVVVLLGDIGVYAFREIFEKYPKRIYNMGICEQSMVGVAAGLAMAGLIPIVHTISPFLCARAYEQIRNDFGFQDLIGTFVGVDVYSTNHNLGLTHSCPEDIEMMNRIPNMQTRICESPEDLDNTFKARYANSLIYLRIK